MPSTSPVREAATLKTRAQGILRDLDGLLASKDLPATMVQPIKGLRAAMHKTWGELKAPAAGEGATGEGEGEGEGNAGAKDGAPAAAAAPAAQATTAPAG